MTEKTDRKRIFFLVLAVAFVYFNSLPNDFIFDDIPLVQNSLWITSANFFDIMRSYRPLRYISYALDYRVFGMNPSGFRLMNIIYHTMTVVALFWALKMFGILTTVSILETVASGLNSPCLKMFATCLEIAAFLTPKRSANCF